MKISTNVLAFFKRLVVREARSWPDAVHEPIARDCCGDAVPALSARQVSGIKIALLLDRSHNDPKQRWMTPLQHAFSLVNYGQVRRGRCRKKAPWGKVLAGSICEIARARSDISANRLTPSFSGTQFQKLFTAIFGISQSCLLQEDGQSRGRPDCQ